MAATPYYTNGSSHVEVTDALLPVLQGNAGAARARLLRPRSRRLQAVTPRKLRTSRPRAIRSRRRRISERISSFFPARKAVCTEARLPVKCRRSRASARSFIRITATISWSSSAKRGTTADSPRNRARKRRGRTSTLAFTQHFDAQSDDAGVEYYRFDPRYATIILPYGVPENVWSVAWSWPGQWLKSTYQAVDNSIVGINREGFRMHADASHGKSGGACRCIRVAADRSDHVSQAAAQEGWVDGYFLPQRDSDATLGWQRQVGLYAAWHFGSRRSGARYASGIVRTGRRSIRSIW